ncbi:MAG: staygreen family protein [Candidatus Thorarchaeota archaeon]
MGRLRPEKLHVRVIPPATEDGPVIPRCYTLTHSDRTGDLFLTIGPEFDRKQIGGWYTRILRDEVLAKWIESDRTKELHVYCQVGRGLGTAKYRESIFRRELPLVLEALRHGDSKLFLENHHLDSAPIYIHFQLKKAEQDLIEHWGYIGEYASLQEQ